jgi:hypothetical protein
MIRLLQFNDDRDVSLTDFFEDDIPEYAILSHRWEAGEVTIKDLTDCTSKGKAGTCCIEKTHAVELSEAIISMFRWYQKRPDATSFYPMFRYGSGKQAIYLPSVLGNLLSEQANGSHEAGPYKNSLPQDQLNSSPGKAIE